MAIISDKAMESASSQTPEHDKKAKQKGLHYPLSPELTSRVIRYLYAFRVVISIARFRSKARWEVNSYASGASIITSVGEGK